MDTGAVLVLIHPVYRRPVRIDAPRCDNRHSISPPRLGAREDTTERRDPGYRWVSLVLYLYITSMNDPADRQYLPQGWSQAQVLSSSTTCLDGCGDRHPLLPLER